MQPFLQNIAQTNKTMSINQLDHLESTPQNYCHRMVQVGADYEN